MAELVSYLWIVPHMRSFYVPPQYSAPLTRGLFCAALPFASPCSFFILTLRGIAFRSVLDSRNITKYFTHLPPLALGAAPVRRDVATG